MKRGLIFFLFGSVLFFLFIIVLVLFNINVAAHGYETFGFTKRIESTNEQISVEGGGAGGAGPNGFFQHGPQRYILVKAYDEVGQIDYSNSGVINFVNRISDFFSLNSYGQMRIVGADGNPFNEDDIFGPYALNLPDECDSRFIPEAIYQLASREIEFFDGLRIIILINDGCFPNAYGYPSIINFGTEENPLVLRFVVGEGIDNLGEGTFLTIAHEIAHGYMGLGHTAYRSCEPNSEISPEDCEILFEYGNPYDILGGSLITGQSNAKMLETARWLSEDGEHRILNVQEDGEYIIKSISRNEPGLKALKFPHKLNQVQDNDINEFLYAEWHTPQGLDRNIPNQDVYDSDIFDGVLFHLSESGFATLIHPIVLEEDLPCSVGHFTPPSTCPRYLRAFNTALPFGQTYTDPNTNTRITIMQPTAVGLPIRVDLGRTDFTPPTINSFQVVERPDDCTAVVEVDAEDENGISKVEFYRWGGNRENSELIDEVSEAPFRQSFDLRLLGRSFIFARVYDGASSEGGIASDNYEGSELFRPDPAEVVCRDIPPIITIRSPIFNGIYEGGVFSTRDREPEEIYLSNYVSEYVYNLGNIGNIYGPIQLDINTESDSILQTFFLQESIYYFTGRTIAGQIFDIRDNPVFESELHETINPSFGKHWFSVSSRTLLGSTTDVFFEVNVLPTKPFVRGNANNDGRFDLSDAIFGLNYLFQGGETPVCLDAADTNDDGRVDISDSISILQYLFSDSGNIGDLGQGVVFDGTYDELDCAESSVPTHSACLGNSCGLVIGEGEDGCSSGVDCCSSSDATFENPDGVNPFVYEDGESCSAFGGLLERHCIEGLPRFVGHGIGIRCSIFGNYICREGACVPVE